MATWFLASLAWILVLTIVSLTFRKRLTYQKTIDGLISSHEARVDSLFKEAELAVSEKTTEVALTEIVELNEGRSRFSVGEAKLRQHFLRWHHFGLDTTVLGFEAHWHEAMLRYGSATEVLEAAKEYSTAHRKLIRGLAEDVYAGKKRKLGAFKATDSLAWPDLYSTFYGLGMIKLINGEFADRRKPIEVSSSLSELVGEEWPDRIADFVQACRTKEGVFGEYPGGPPGLITSDAADFILTSLGRGSTSLDPDAMTQFVEKCGREEDYGLMFANNPAGPPQGTCHRYVATLNEQHEFLDEKQISRSIRALHACRNEDGGFGNEPGATSTLFATRHHLAALHRYYEKLHSKEEWTEQVFRIAPDIKSFLHLWEKQGFAFSFTPGSVGNILAMRDALDIISRLKEEGVHDILNDFELQQVTESREKYYTGEGFYVGYLQDATGSKGQ